MEKTLIKGILYSNKNLKQALMNHILTVTKAVNFSLCDLRDSRLKEKREAFKLAVTQETIDLSLGYRLRCNNTSQG